jgi:hypothetical protein
MPVLFNSPEWKSEAGNPLKAKKKTGFSLFSPRQLSCVILFHFVVNKVFRNEFSFKFERPS